MQNEIEEIKITGDTSDGYHTFNELYEFRKLYNAGFFNLLPKECRVHKSKKHSDGELCFGGGWFIVTAYLNGKQISNHYELKDWDLFQCEEREKADEWDNHTPKDVVERLKEYLNTPNTKLQQEKDKAYEWGVREFADWLGEDIIIEKAHEFLSQSAKEEKE